jgi:uncharacterized cupredoxin-like copper-binding protein
VEGRAAAGGPSPRYPYSLKHAEAMKRNPEMEHHDPNARRLAPKQKDEIVWRFTKPGEFQYACLIPGHLEAGMSGTVDVK